MDSNWELKYPFVYVQALPRLEALSDHATIFLTTGISRTLSKCPFKLELDWLHREGFSYLVRTVWEKPVVGRSPIQRWSNKLCATCRYLGGWARHMTR
jgi:hypothetical protein